MKVFQSLAVLCAAVLVTACGGGGDDVTTPPLPEPVVTAASEADVTLTQDASLINVTPGETVRVTSLAITCKQDKTATGGTDPWCRDQVPLGDIGIYSGVELVGAIRVLIDGQEVGGWISKEADGLYRFRSYFNTPIYKTGSIEVMATISPYAKSGDFSLVVFKTASAAFDKILKVIPAHARLHVNALPQYAPMTLTASEGTVVYRGEVGESPQQAVKINARCADGTTCNAELDFGQIHGLVPGTPVEVCYFEANGQSACWTTGVADGNGSAFVGMIWLGHQQSVEIRLYPKEAAYVYANSVKATVTGKDIAPKRPSVCTAVTRENCKG